jgi:hypothetical protein
MTINYSKQVLLKRGNSAVSSAYVGPLGEVTVDTDFATIRVHDGVTPGGHLSTSSASSDTPPENPRESTLWYDTVGGRLYVYYAGAWIDASPAGDLLLAANVANLSVLVTGLTSDVANVETHIDSLDANIGAFETAFGANIGAFETAVNVTVGTLNANINTLNQTIAAFEAQPGPTSDAWVDDAPPDISNVGALWYDDISGRLYVYYDGAWVDANPPITTGFGNVLPSANVTYSLGSEQYQWKDLWVSNNTIYIGNTPITVSNGSLLVGGNVVSGGGNPFNQNLNTTDAATFANVSATIGFISQINGTNPGGELVIQTDGTHNWIFDANGTTTFPGGGHISATKGGTALDAGYGYNTSLTTFYANANYAACVTGDAQTGTLNITAYNDGGPNPSRVWSFDKTGTLTFPTELSIESLAPYYEGAPVTGTVIQQTANTDLNLYSIGANARTVIGWLENTLNSELGGNVAEIQFNNFVGEARIVTGEYGNQVNGWQFRADGNLVLPPNSYVLNSDDSIYSGGGGGGGAANTGNIVFSGSSIGLDEGSAEAADTYINISPNGEGWAYLQLPNDTSANITDTRLWNAAGNVEIGTGDFSNLGPSYTWNFNKDGSLTLPGNIQSTAGTLVFQPNTAQPDLAWTITNDNIGGANVSILYAPAGDDNHIGELIFPGSDGVGGLVYVGNVGTPYDNAMNLIGQGANTSVKISTVGGDWQWTFGNTGNLAMPYGSIIVDSGYETGTAGFIAPTGGVALVSTMLYNSGNIASQILQNREGSGSTIQLSLYKDTADPAKTWTFDNDGITTLPGKLWARASDSGSIAFTNNGVDEHGYLKVDAGYNMIVNAESNFFVKRNGTDRLAITDTTSDVKAVTDVRFVSNLAGSNKTWTFAASGIATLPSNSYVETTDANLKIGSQGTVTIRSNAATVGGTQAWTFGTNGATTFPGNISVPGNLSNIAGFAFYNGNPISIVATAPIWALSFINPYYIEIAKTGLPAGFDTLLGSGAWTATAGGLTLTVVSVVTNGDYWRITVAENPDGTISTTATFNRAASGANIVIPSSGSINFANGVNILSTVGNYGNANVASYLLQFDGNIEFTSSTARIGNVDVVTVGDHIRSPAYQFSNGASILANVATKVTSSWTVTTGTNTYSFTVPESGTYLLWVIGNIPNGIIAWNATATITNSNVPVVGAQYAWVYDGGGSPIDFVSIPNQFTGTGNTIVRSSSAPSMTTNRFDFGINNTSGGAVTVTYGYTKL